MSRFMRDTNNSKAICGAAWKHLNSTKGNKRKQQILILLESKGLGPVNDTEFVTYHEFVYKIYKILQELTMYWQAIIRWIEPERGYLMSTPLKEVQRAYSVVTSTFVDHKSRKEQIASSSSSTISKGKGKVGTGGGPQTGLVIPKVEPRFRS